LVQVAGIIPAKEVWAQTPETQRSSRPDSIRAFVLDRIREQAAPDTISVQESTVIGVSSEGRSSTTTGPPRPTVDGPAELPTNADSIMRALVQLEGFNSASYSGVRADFDARNRQLVLFGTAESRALFSGRGGRIEADTSITYEEIRGRIRTTGRADMITSTGDPLQAERLIYDLNAGRGTALGAETTYSEGGQWIVRGNLDSVEDDLLFGSLVRFTTCDLTDPHSYFQASQLKVVGGQVLVARSVRVYIDDVPIMWLPFMAQNLGTGRVSGILTPTFSINDVVRTSSGYNRRLSNLGYYWAMSDYSDMSVALDWFANNYTAVQGGLRYRWARKFLDGSMNVKRYWRETGRTELGFDTNHRWELSERTVFRASGRYISSASFVQEHSFDPRETVSTVDSDANMNRRFDWGQLTLGSSRKQYLTEDRTETTLPSASLSLSTLTLFGASPQASRWYNNIAVSGSMSWDRRLADRPVQADSIFTFSLASEVRTQGSARGSMSLGDLSLRGSLATRETLFEDVPGPLFVPGGAIPDGIEIPEGRGDFRQGEVSWSAGLSYQQRLIGATTLTPSLSMDASLVRVDSIPEAQEYVQGPRRVRAGVVLQTDVYGFYPGFSRFESLRHKMTPSVSWSYSPEVTPGALQARVFGPRAIRAQNTITFGFNQTWEAKISEEVEADAVDGDQASRMPVVDRLVTELDVPRVEVPLGIDPLASGDSLALASSEPVFRDEGLSRLPPSRNVVLLGLRTTAVTYDLIEADSTGNFVDGFRTMRLRNRVVSDYLQGLNLSFTHALFDDSKRQEGGSRKLAPHLSQLSLGFSLDQDSEFLRALGGLLGIRADPQPELLDPTLQQVPDGPLDQSVGFASDRVIPGQDRSDGGSSRAWEADVNYSLTRPRGSARGSRLRGQMVQARLSFAPSAQWTVDWSTSYDAEAGRFNDHVVNLRRDIHEWEARFGFVQTAIGNWSFQFEVALRANQDLRFDYRQRSLNNF
jgi:hypothetical protein